MTNNGKIVKVAASDELASVIDKIVTTDAKLVFLAIEDEAFIAQNVLNFRLIKREAETVDKEVVVVTQNSRISSLASKAALKVKKRLEEDYEEVQGTENHYTREVADILPPSRTPRAGAAPTADLRSMRSGTQKPEEQEEKETEAEKEAETGAEKENAAAKPEPSAEEHFKKEPRKERKKKLKKKQEEDIAVSTYTPQAEKKRKKRGVNLKTPPFVKKSGSYLASLFTKKPLYTFGVLAGIVAIVALGYVLTFVLPKATIVLNPYSVEDEIAFSLVADSNISSADYTKGIIPAQILEEKQETTFTYKATGTAQLEERATGIVTIYNEYSSNPQTLVANTRLVSSEGRLFRTAETVVVPGASIEDGSIVPSSTTVPVRADEPGQDYNIGPTTFSIPGFRGDPRYLAFYGESGEAMRGGYSGVATVITENDMDGVREKIELEYLPQIEDALRSKVPDGLTLIEDSMDTNIETLDINGEVGDPSEEFDVRFVGVVQAFLIKGEDTENSIAHHFINSTEYSKDFELDSDRDVEYVVKELDFERGYTEFNVNAKQRFNRIVSTDNILEEVKGKGEVEVRRILSRNDALERAQVRFWPFWVSTVPGNSENIEIKVEI